MNEELLKDGAPAEDGPSEDEGLWPGDAGTLGINARRALLQLIRGPMITAEGNRELWQALLDDRRLIASRLADLFLDLVVKDDDGIAFVQNAPAFDARMPKAVRNQPLTLIDTVLVLTLRRDLMASQEGRVFVGREDTFAAVSQYRPLDKLDEAAFRKRLDGSWSKLVNAGILMKSEDDDRYEVSPVLKLIFGAEEVNAVNDAFDAMLEEEGAPDAGLDGDGDGDGGGDDDGENGEDGPQLDWAVDGRAAGEERRAPDEAIGGAFAARDAAAERRDDASREGGRI